MTRDEETQANAVIAKFMGYKIISPSMRNDSANFDHDYWEKVKEPEPTDLDTSPKVLCAVGCEQYRWDWNWLMRVVDEIENIQIEDRRVFVTLGIDHC